MIFSIIQLMIMQLILPVVFIISLWKGSFHSKLDWMVQMIFSVFFISWIFFSSPWDWFSYYLRFIWPILLLFAIYMSWKKARSLPTRIKYDSKQKWSLGIYGVLLVVFGMYNVLVFSGYSTDEQAIELDFPLKNGVYYIGQGGNHVQINYHNEYPPQRYALDIVELNPFGARASGIYPKQLDKYDVFGDELYSPCSGEVLEARDHLPDLIPPEADSERPEGNFVNLKCEGKDANVYIAHMQEGSVEVEAGDFVEKGEHIGLVGNSGNTSEPHLHIHAEKDGEGVPIHFNGRFLVRNSLVW
ncbi:M23 family metallopeptidase [Bacillus sp. Marseille-Q3570]|uniref:M23 family metallopeptidase n=1 Tax=Bacillus sp. Marseille-Q3570 TaxID=2963522 RepID=UPI0021B7E265|nr:M23 family metallopeptidase [Bacillus sp. Marseille-Q3570]